MTRQTAQVVAGVALAAVAVIAYVVLRAIGDDAAGLTVFVTPFVAALLVNARTDKVTEAQNAVLSSIHHNTNGVLAGKIRDGVREVLAERDQAAVAATVGAGPAPLPIPPSAYDPNGTDVYDPAAEAVQPEPDTLN